MASRPRFALLLPNQSVSFGATSPSELVEIAEFAEANEGFDDVFVGDNLFARPRLESIALLSAVAARTRRLRLGVACMASFSLRHPILLAAQWSALDNLSEGRTVLAACIGGREFGANFDRGIQSLRHRSAGAGGAAGRGDSGSAGTVDPGTCRLLGDLLQFRGDRHPSAAGTTAVPTHLDRRQPAGQRQAGDSSARRSNGWRGLRTAG